MCAPKDLLNLVACNHQPEIFALQLAGPSPKTSNDQKVGGNEFLSFLNDNGQLAL